ncbi:GPO family capsid scaffolding protein [Serratia sp. IR-2025]
MSQLMTDWICICAEGETGDKRFVERQWLIDAAELYDPKLKTAMIWPEHSRETEYGNCGEVLALKCEEGEDGIMRLFARLRPNIGLMRANAAGQLVFCSAEFTPDGNFRGTGKSYLEGLAVTDEPASVYTERLHFSQTRNQGLIYAATQPLNLIGKNMAKDKKNSWRKFFSLEDELPEETTGEPDKLQALAEAVAALENRVSALEGKTEETAATVEEVQEDVETVKEVVDTQEFKLLRDNIGGIVKNFSKLDERITKLPNKNPKGDARKPFKFL